MTCGSVDDGKSTLIGRLLFDTKTILTDTLSQIEKTSQKRGMTALDLSLITDGLQAEREQGITIDVAMFSLIHLVLVPQHLIQPVKLEQQIISQHTILLTYA